MSTYRSIREVDHRESLPDLVRNLAEQFSQLIRMEIKLVKVETREGAKKVVVSGVFAWMAMKFTGLFFIFLTIGILLALVQAAEITWYGAALLTAAICLGLVGLCLGIAWWRLKVGEPHLAGND